MVLMRPFGWIQAYFYLLHSDSVILIEGRNCIYILFLTAWWCSLGFNITAMIATRAQI